MEQPRFDPSREAAELYALSSELLAVIVFSLLVVRKKRGRGVHRRNQDSVLRDAIRAVENGDLAAAKRTIEEASWTGPPTVWWVESQHELAERIAAIDAVIGEPAGVDLGLITDQVGYYDLFPDE